MKPNPQQTAYQLIAQVIGGKWVPRVVRSPLPPQEPPDDRRVLECASPLALWLGSAGRAESARGLAHSKTLARGRGFMGAMRRLSVGGEGERLHTAAARRYCTGAATES